jgi:hypothetical protein
VAGRSNERVCGASNRKQGCVSAQSCSITPLKTGWPSRGNSLASATQTVTNCNMSPGSCCSCWPGSKHPKTPWGHASFPVPVPFRHAPWCKCRWGRCRIVVAKSPFHSLTLPTRGSECNRLISTIEKKTLQSRGQLQLWLYLLIQQPAHQTVKFLS